VSSFILCSVPSSISRHRTLKHCRSHVQKLHDSLPSQMSTVEVCLLRLFTSPVLQSKYCNDLFRKENTRKIRKESVLLQLSRPDWYQAKKQDNVTLWRVRPTIVAVKTTMLYVCIFLRMFSCLSIKVVYCCLANVTVGSLWTVVELQNISDLCR
jgi:hypothetical protein